MPTLEITYTDDVDLRAQLRRELLKHKEWVTIKELACRHRLSSGAVMTQRIKRWQQRGLIQLDDDVSVKRGASGRILRLKVTPELQTRLELLG